MKQLFVNIGFITILFAFTLNINYCKKNNTIEPEPENPIKITGTISNNITEQSNNGNPENTLDVEINDTIHVIAKGTADHENSDGFDTFRGGLYENGDRVRFLQLTGSLDGDGNIEYVLNLEGNEKMNFKNTFDGKKLDVMIEYHIRGDYEYKYHKIGEINIKAEKDYDIDEIKGEGQAKLITKNNIEKIATILSQPGVLYSGVRVLTYNEAFEKITNYLDDDEKNGEMKNFIIYDYNNGFSNQVNIEMTRGPPDRAWKVPYNEAGEKLMEQLKNIYGVNDR